MGIKPNIFGDPKPAETSSKYADAIVGAFKLGYQDAKGLPVSVDKWIVRTDDPDVAEEISTMFGGEVENAESDKYPLAVFTETDLVAVTVEPGGIRSGFVLWGNRALVSRCDGEIIQWSKDSPEDVGTRCSCAGKTEAERDKAAKNGTGCKPDVSIVFSLDRAPGLGKFRLQSGSKVLLKDIQATETKVENAEGPTRLSIGLERVTTKAGFTFTKVNVK